MALKELTPSSVTKKTTIPLRWIMVLGFGGLVALSVGLVLFMSVASNFSNTYSLLNSKALALIDNMENSIRSQTNQAERTVRAMARLVENGNLSVGRLESEKTDSRQSLLESLMETAPVIEALLVYDLEGSRSGVFRTPQGDFLPITFAKGSELERPRLLNNPATDSEKHPVWAEPVVINQMLFHNVGFPLEKDGQLIGYAVAAIGQNNMNDIISTLARDNDTTVFVLTNDNKIIAHSRNRGLFKNSSSIAIADFPDPALRQLPNAEPVEQLSEDNGVVGKSMRVFESGRGISKSGFVFILRPLEGYAAEPYQLGAYFGKAEIGAEIRRIFRTGMAGLAALIFAVITSFALSRRLANPMNKIARVANDFSNLELRNFTPLPSSRIREIDDQAMAMNSMHTALSEFSHYLPRTLVKRLMASGSQATRSVEREITIMFADIVGFTTMSEGLNAIDTAALLNSHFDMICREITRHNGTVDKFIGDGLMAFWGAPDADNNQATNALNTARDIVKVLVKNNINRRNENLPPLRLRIGIHTGRVVVGNIGSCDRHNYTIVGDAVNVANRLEQLGKQFIEGDEAIILTSIDTWAKAEMPKNLYTLGLQKIRGREALIEIFASSTSIGAQRAENNTREVG